MTDTEQHALILENWPRTFASVKEINALDAGAQALRASSPVVSAVPPEKKNEDDQARYAPSERASESDPRGDLWRPIDSAPNHERVLLSNGDYVISGEIWDGDALDDESRRLTRVTHWMPLPAPPSDGSVVRDAERAVTPSASAAPAGTGVKQANSPSEGQIPPVAIRDRIKQVARTQSTTYGAGRVGAITALRYVLALDADDTKDRPPTNVIIAQLLADLGGDAP